MECALGIDLGTSNLKVLLVGPDQKILASASATYSLRTPRPGWAEQDPQDWYGALTQALRQLRTQPGFSQESHIVAVGLSGQMHSLVVVDNAGTPIYPAISWADTRSQAECADLIARVGRDTLVAETGNPPVAAFTASKLLWLRTHEPAAFARSRAVLLPKDYLRFHLTGTYATDVSDSSATLLNSLLNRTWSPRILNSLGLDPALFPPVLESGEIVGTMSATAAAATGLPAGIPIIAGAGDQECAAIGAGMLDPGPLLITTGTGGQVFGVADRPTIDPQGRVHALCHALPGRWHVMAAIQAAGLALQWAADLLYPGHPAAERVLALLDAAMTVPTRSSSPLFVPDITGNRTPHMDDRARGLFFGLDLSHGRADLGRAAVEGVAFGLRQCVDAVGSLGLATDDVWLTGGLSRHDGFRTILATALNRSLHPLAVADASALGAATLAGHAAGLWPLSMPVHYNQPAALPSTAAVELAQERYILFQDLYDSLRERFAQQSSIIDPTHASLTNLKRETH